MEESAPNRLLRGAAVGTQLIALVYLGQLERVFHAATYLGVLLCAGILVGLVAAYLLWVEGAWEGRLLAGGLAVTSLAGHLLNLWLGVPGAHELAGRLSTLAMVSVAAEVATLLLLAADALRRRNQPRSRHPYAL